MKSLIQLSFFLFTFSILFIQCDDKEEDLPAPIPCLKMFDANGQPIGTHGDCDGNQDWESQSLTSAERDLFDFEDGLPKVNSSDNLIFERIHIYPNPIPKGNPIGVTVESADEPYKYKIVLIDESEKIVFRGAFPSENQNIQIQMPDTSFVFVMSKAYKMLYHYYTDNHGVLFEGSGRILVCDAPNIVNIEEDCF